MDWKDIAGAVGKAAPILGTLLGGPAGAAVGALVASALGTGGTADDVSQAMKDNPDAMLKLRELEANKTIRLQELAAQQAQTELAAQIETIKTDAADRDSARKREVAANDTITPRLLAFFVTAGFFGVLGYLLVQGKPEDGGDALLVMLGALGGAWASIISYYFGSSAGSARKDATIQAQAER